MKKHVSHLSVSVRKTYEVEYKKITRDEINDYKKRSRESRIRISKEELLRSVWKQRVYLDCCDPVTGVQFSLADDITSILRCKGCGTFYFSFTVNECGNICISCRHPYFWNHRNKEFYKEKMP